MAEATQVEAPAKPSPEEKRAAAEAEVDALVKKGLKALDEFEKLDQKQVDRIVAKASVAALNKHLVLAKMAVDETGRGLVEDKATKNIFAFRIILLFGAIHVIFVRFHFIILRKKNSDGISFFRQRRDQFMFCIRHGNLRTGAEQFVFYQGDEFVPGFKHFRLKSHG